MKSVNAKKNDIKIPSMKDNLWDNVLRQISWWDFVLFCFYSSGKEKQQKSTTI